MLRIEVFLRKHFHLSFFPGLQRNWIVLLKCLVLMHLPSLILRNVELLHLPSLILRNPVFFSFYGE